MRWKAGCLSQAFLLLLILSVPVLVGFDIFGGTNSLPKSGGTMTGPISMGNSTTFFQNLTSNKFISVGVANQLQFNDTAGLNGIVFADSAGVTMMSLDAVAADVINVNQPFRSTLAAPTNFTRVGPNADVLTTAPSAVTIATTCTTIAVPSGTPKLAWVELEHQASSGTVAGEMLINSALYSDSACTVYISPLFNPGPRIFVYSGDTTSGHLVGGGDYVYPVYVNGAANIYGKTTVTLTGCTGCTDTSSLLGFLVLND